MLAVFVAAFWGAQAYSPDARMLPMVICVSAIVLSAIQLARELSRSKAVTETVGVTPIAAAKAFLWIVGFIASVILFGFSVGAPLATAAFVYIAGREPIWIAGLSGLACFALLYGLFERLFQVSLFEGLFPVGRLLIS